MKIGMDVDAAIIVKRLDYSKNLDINLDTLSR